MIRYSGRNVELHDDLTDEQILALHELYQSERWTEGRDLKDVRRMLDHSDEYIALIDSETDALVGFARVLTDYVYKALISDVIVANAYRNRGLGHTLMDAIMHHPALERVAYFDLYCLGKMVPFYEE